MSTPQFFITPGYGEMIREKFHYTQAVRVGDRVEVAGQGGWSDDWEFPEALTDEIDQVFRNVERTLATAGASWADVITMRSYHVDLDQDGVAYMADRLREYMPDQPPLWTVIGVSALGDPHMRAEIEVTAIVRD